MEKLGTELYFYSDMQLNYYVTYIMFDMITNKFRYYTGDRNINTTIEGKFMLENVNNINSIFLKFKRDGNEINKNILYEIISDNDKHIIKFNTNPVYDTNRYMTSEYISLYLPTTFYMKNHM